MYSVQIQIILHTACSRISNPFYIVIYYIKWVTTSWTHELFSWYDNYNSYISLEISFSFVLLMAFLVNQALENAQESMHRRMDGSWYRYRRVFNYRVHYIVLLKMALVSLGPRKTRPHANISKSIESRALLLVSVSSLDQGFFEGSWRSALVVKLFEILTWGRVVQGPRVTNAKFLPERYSVTIQKLSSSAFTTTP